MIERQTVAIRRASGKRSNVALEDYDPATMTLWDAPVAAPIAESVPEAAHEKKRGAWGGKRVKRG